MKSYFFSFLFAIVASVGTMFADGTKIGDLYYNLKEDKTAEVTYMLKWDVNNYKGLTTANIPASVTYSGITYSVTSIGGGAFSHCSSLTSVTIPNSVTSIGNNAFYGCGLATPIYNAHVFAYAPKSISGSYAIPKGIKSIAGGAFRDCETLISVTIPNSVTSIGDCAFCACGWLTSVTIPNSVTSIGDYAFTGCGSLTSVTFGNSVTSIGKRVFDGCSSLTSIVWNATNYPDSSDDAAPFYEYYAQDKDFRPQITSFRFGKEVKHIPANLCCGMTNLKSLTIPNSVTSIGTGAFYGCGMATPIYNAHVFAYAPKSISGSYAIPSGIKTIAGGAFAHCENLKSVTIPNSVTSIGDYAFEGCSSLKSITIPNSVTSIGESAFEECSSLTSVTIPNSVTSIGDWAFHYHCSSLPVIDNIRYADSYLVEAVDKTLSAHTIRNGTKWIGALAFSSCYNLTSIDIPNSVTSIGERAFRDCSGLTSVTIPNSVTKIGENAFPQGTKLIFELKYRANLMSNNKTHGAVDIQHKSAINIIATAQPKYGYSFVKWSDGNEENPRRIILTQDTTIYAEFGISRFGSCGEGEKLNWKYDKDTRTLSISGNGQLTENIHFGLEAMKEMETLVIQDGIMSIGDNAFYEAGMLRTVYVPKEAPHLGQNVFPKSASIYMPCDAKTRGYQNPRHGWSSYDVRYEPLTYKVIGKSSDTNAGYVKTPEHICDPLQVTAKSYEGYHFVKWSDGETRNPRQMTSLKCDTTFMAEFEISRSGECGYRNQLHWEYDKGTKTLTISGQGALTENMFFGLEALQEMEQLIIGDGVCVIGLAFRGCSTLKSITNHSLVPQQMLDGAFDSSVYSSAILYLPKKAKGDYKKTDGWKNFKKVKTIKE